MMTRRALVAATIARGQRRQILDILQVRGLQGSMNLKIQSSVRPPGLDALIDDANVRAHADLAEQERDVLRIEPDAGIDAGFAAMISSNPR
jgi:hypothetical protein